MNADVRTVLSVVLSLGFACACAAAAPTHGSGGTLAPAHAAAGGVETTHPAVPPTARPLPVSLDTCGRGGVRGTCGANERREYAQFAPPQCKWKPDQCSALAAIRDEALALRRADGGRLSAAHRAALQDKINAILPAAP